MILRCLFISYISTSLSLELSYIYIYLTSMIGVCIVPVSHHYFSCLNGHYFYDMKMLNIQTPIVQLRGLYTMSLEKNTPVHTSLMDRKKYKPCIVYTPLGTVICLTGLRIKEFTLFCFCCFTRHPLRTFHNLFTTGGRVNKNVNIWHNHLVIILLLVQKSQTTTWDV